MNNDSHVHFNDEPKRNGRGTPLDVGGSPLARPNPRAAAGIADLARLQSALGESEEKRRFSAADYIRLLWKGKWIIGACVVVAGLLTAYYTFSLPFVYEASLEISVNERETEPVFGQPTWYYNRDRALKNELQFMTSRPVLELTALSLLRQRYLDSTRTNSDSVIPLVAAAERTLAYWLRRATPERRAEKLTEYIANALPRMTTISPSKDADIISIVTRSGDPDECALITNRYADIYREYSLNNNQSKIRQVEKYLAGRLDTTRELLAKQELALKNFQQGTGIIGDAINVGDLNGQENQYQQSIKQLDIKISALERRLLDTRGQLDSIEPRFSQELSMALPQSIQSLTDQIARNQAKLNYILADDPVRGSEVWYQGQIAGMRRTIADLKKRLDEEVQAFKETSIGSIPGGADVGGSPTAPLVALKGKILDDEISLSSLRSERSATQQALGEVRAQMSRIPTYSMELDRIVRGKKSLAEIYNDLEESYNKKIIDKTSVMSTVRIISQAQPNSSPISPNRKANLMVGVLVGLALGVGIVLLIAYADTTIHSPDELSDKGITVLAAIPAIEGSRRARARRKVQMAESGRLSPQLITQANPNSPITESYRSLRTAIQFASIDDPIRMLLITSSVPQEGKSTTTANLAIVLANSGVRTLLVDCDLRRPIVHSIFGMTKEPGLVNALLGTVSLADAIRPSDIENLDLLASGAIPPNPSELLGSRRMADLFAELREMYDMVLIDSPPVGVVTDGVILSTRADATITVVRAHRTKMEFLERTSEEIGRVSGPLLGVVLNEFDATQSYGSSYKYYRYYKYYGYYGSHEEDRGRKKRRAETARKNVSITGGDS